MVGLTTYRFLLLAKVIGVVDDDSLLVFIRRLRRRTPGAWRRPTDYLVDRSPAVRIFIAYAVRVEAEAVMATSCSRRRRPRVVSVILDVAPDKSITTAIRLAILNRKSY